MSNSALVTCSMPAYTGNYTRGRYRYGQITEITVHHCAGVMSVVQLGKLWQRKGRNGSSHYGVSGTEVGQYVEEADIAWTNTNWPANCRAVTIETSNSAGGPDWPVADDTLQTLIRLVADIAKRNGLHPLVLGKSLTWHSMYTSTACPGPYLKARLQYIVDEANKINTGASAPEEVEDDMQFYSVFGNKKCEVFASQNTSDVVGTLTSGMNYPVLADAGTAGGYHWVRIYVAGMPRWAVVLDDRARIISAGSYTAAQICQTINDQAPAKCTEQLADVQEQLAAAHSVIAAVRAAVGV